MCQCLVEGTCLFLPQHLESQSLVERDGSGQGDREIEAAPSLADGCFRMATYEPKQVNTRISTACRWVL